jgi:hypothetical protein
MALALTRLQPEKDAEGDADDSQGESVKHAFGPTSQQRASCGAKAPKICCRPCTTAILTWLASARASIPPARLMPYAHHGHTP